MITDLILGTAGHIDHGKTSLVKALTGVDTDRLPEEKRRGITIELGFAELALDDGQGNAFRLGIVDVPGHERFVRNMLAGATGMDLAMLIVAADESVKQQTREHLDILKLLRLEAGVIVLTKCDVPEPDWIDLVAEEIRELVAGTFLAEAPLVRCSAHTGQGLDELRQALIQAATKVQPAALRRRSAGPFRLPIDRTFTIAGHGTVVTGSVASGQAQVGDELVIEPGGTAVRVRGVQHHDRPVEEVHRGQRAAMNLAGVHHDAIERGHELAAPGYLVPTRRLTVRLSLLETMPRRLKSRTRARLHLGTAEVMAAVLLLDRDELTPGESAYAQLLLSHPVVAAWSQPFVLRSESPVFTMGGGTVLDPHAERVRKIDAARVAVLPQLETGDVLERSSAALYLFGLRTWQPSDLLRMAGCEEPQPVIEQLTKRGELAPLRLSPTRTLVVHRQTLADLSTRVETVLSKLHKQFPLDALVDRARVVSRFDYLQSPPLVDALLARMVQEKRIRTGPRGLALAGFGPKLSANEQKLFDEIIAKYKAAGLQTPTVAEVQASVPKNQAAVPQLIKLAASDGHLAAIDPDYYIHAEAEAELKRVLTENFAGGQGLTVSQIRELLGVSRKYAVPICEYLDRTGFTRRDGDMRFLKVAVGTAT